MGAAASRLRRAVRIGLGALAGLILVLCVLIAVAARSAGERVHARAVEAAEKLGQRIGRTVTVGPAHVRFGAELSVEIEHVRIDAAPGQTGVAAEPLLEVASIRVGVEAWPLVRSRGREVQMSAVIARAPVVRVVRLEDGRLSYADILEHLAAEAPHPKPAREVHVGRVAITGGSIRLHDLSKPNAAPLALERIDVTIPALVPGAPLDLSVDAAVLAPDPNLHLALTLAPPAGEDAPPRPLGRLTRGRIHLAPLAIEPLIPFLPAPRGLSVQRATVSADAVLAVDPAGPISVEGAVTAAGLTLAHAAQGGQMEALGQPADVKVRADLTIDPAGPSLLVRALTIGAGEMTLDARADLRGPVSAPEVRALSVHTGDVSFERLLALAPPAILPAGVALHGPIALRADGHGDPRAAEIDVAVDLGGADVHLPGFSKPAGTPLSAELRGKAGDGGLDIASLGLAIGPLALRLHGKVASEKEVDLSFDSGTVPLDAVLRLFPAVARAAPAGVTLGGDVQASGRVEVHAASTHVETRVALRRASAKTVALTLEGGADLTLSVRSSPGALGVVADLDAAAARVVVPGRIDKAAGAPLAIHVAAERAGAVTTVREARIALAGATVQGSGRYDATSHTLSVEATRCELDLGALAGAVPMLGALPAALAGAKLHAAVTFAGDTRDLQAAHLRLAGLDLAAPLGHVHGLLDLDGLSPPRKVAFDLAGESLDVDALSSAPPAAGGGAAALERMEIDGKLHLDRLRARGLNARDVDAEGGLTAGVVALRRLQLSAFGGAIRAGGSHVDIAHGAPSFALRAHVDHVDLAALPQVAWSRGRLDADVSIDGKGADWASAAPTLAGTVGLDLKDAHVHTIHTLRAHVLNPLIGKIAEKAKEKHPTREVDMSIGKATVRVRVGHGEVATTAPARVETEEGTLTLDGKAGLDGSLAFGGAIVIPPAAIDKASSGKLVPFKDVTVRLRVTGHTGHPEVELLELGKTLEALAGSGVHGLVKRIEAAVEKK